jgi:phosphate/sulfate permease
VLFPFNFSFAFAFLTLFDFEFESAANAVGPLAAIVSVYTYYTETLDKFYTDGSYANSVPTFFSQTTANATALKAYKFNYTETIPNVTALNFNDRQLSYSYPIVISNGNTTFGSSAPLFRGYNCTNGTIFQGSKPAKPQVIRLQAPVVPLEAKDQEVPIWVLAIGAAGIVAGLALWGWRSKYSIRAG